MQFSREVDQPGFGDEAVRDVVRLVGIGDELLVLDEDGAEDVLRVRDAVRVCRLAQVRDMARGTGSEGSPLVSIRFGVWNAPDL